MSRSKFPNQIDSFQELFDLPYNKLQDAQRLTELKMKDKLSNAEQNELMTLTSSLQEYIMTPETWNTFADAIVALETFFSNNVKGYITNQQQVWDSYIKQFKVVGKWAVGVNYKFQNIVTDANGDMQICMKDHTSTAATDPLTNQTLWFHSSFKGDKGDIGLNVAYKGEWDDTKAYAMADAVSFGKTGSNAGLVYFAKRANTNKPPSANGDDWQLYAQLYVGTSEHPGQAPGLHFIEVTG